MTIPSYSRSLRTMALALGSAMVAAACATQPVEPTPQPAPPPPDDTIGRSAQPEREPELDPRQVQRSLGMDRRPHELGYREKRFNACKLGLQKGGVCKEQTLVVVHFQLECRDTEGTVQAVYRSEVQPIRSDELTWKLGTLEGSTESDRDGFGQVVTVAPSSQRKQRFRITLRGNKFLSLTAGDIKRVVTPKDWCE